jgi:hypothetical protein
MKKSVISAVVLLLILATAHPVFSETAAGGPPANPGLFLLQQQLQTIQRQLSASGADAGDQVDAITILGTWSGKSPAMKPDGTCIDLPVEVTITHQCGQVVKGTIKARGVIVPVYGTFTGIYLQLNGTKTGTPTWFASIYASYSAATDSLTVVIFSFQNLSVVEDYVYDGGWKLSRQ